MKNFINFHVLISHSPSCINRDDMNMQKSAVFGGKRRVRISSQSLKRAMRHSGYYLEHLGKPSIRTRSLGRIKAKSIEALGERFPAETIVKAIEWISEKSGIGEDSRADAVAPWVMAEIARFCEEIDKADADLDEKKLKKHIEKNAAEFRAATGQAVDIALSGRMATSGLMIPVDGAMAVAHAITTHTVDSDVDWFTAVDDLVEDEGEVGAGHLNTQEFSSGVFYRYASLNITQLQKNLGAVPRDRALEIAGHLVHLLATVVPDAKQQSFAAHNLADAVLVSFADQPLSLANAFEKAVQADQRQGGYRLPSFEALLSHWDRLDTGYGLGEHPALFSIFDRDVVALPDRVAVQPNLAALQAWIAGDGQA